MGLLGMIGKVAGSKVVGKVEDAITKKQNSAQTSKYCLYIKNNITRICAMLSDLQDETKTLLCDISASKNIKMSFREKGELRRSKDKVTLNLKYLYLSRDFFTALSKNASGLVLQNEELMLVIKFAPYFDGAPVFAIEDEEDDDSLLGAFKEVGQEFMSLFVSSKNNSKHFTLQEYLYRYQEKISEYIMPDINSAIESFKIATATLDINPETIASSSVTPVGIPQSTSVEEISCPNCGVKLGSNPKFCPECGNKIEIKQPAFCTQCGQALSAGSKFCANCGAKI